MEKLKGRLLYMGWSNLPWKLVTSDGEVDLWPIVSKFLNSLHGKHASHKHTLEGYTLSADKESEFVFKYVPDELILPEIPYGFGMSNVHAYLDESLCWLSGRLVEIEIEYGEQMKFTADASEDVYGVYFVGDGNSCEVPSGTEKTVCKAARHDCCIFLTVDAGGFLCDKFSGSMARFLLDRLAKGKMRARSRIGNCAVIGRKEGGVVMV